VERREGESTLASGKIQANSGGLGNPVPSTAIVRRELEEKTGIPKESGVGGLEGVAGRRERNEERGGRKLTLSQWRSIMGRIQSVGAPLFSLSCGRCPPDYRAAVKRLDSVSLHRRRYPKMDWSRISSEGGTIFPVSVNNFPLQIDLRTRLRLPVPKLLD